MFTAIGKYMMNLFDQVGGAAQMVRSSLFWVTHSRFEFHQAVDQSVTIGVESLGVTALTSLFTGMVLALQAGNTIGNIFHPGYIYHHHIHGYIAQYAATFPTDKHFPFVGKIA